ncbi:unnamed protein product [Brassica oleracea]
MPSIIYLMARVIIKSLKNECQAFIGAELIYSMSPLILQFSSLFFIYLLLSFLEPSMTFKPF